MKRVEKVVLKLKGELESKNILEVACGCGEFSICASKLAKTVHCIDLVDKRLYSEAKNCANLTFSIMDATAMTYPDNSFDTVVIYNAIGHLEDVLNGIIDECLRVLRSDGHLHIISSCGLDKQVIANNLLPLLKLKNISYKLNEDRSFIYVQI